MKRSELVRTLHAFGLIVTIRSETAEIFSALDRQLPPLPRAPATAVADVVYGIVRVRASDDFAVLRGRRARATARRRRRLVHDLHPVLARTQVALGLLPHCPGVRQRPADTLSTLRVVAARARGFEGVRGDAQLAARALFDQARELRTLW